MIRLKFGVCCLMLTALFGVSLSASVQAQTKNDKKYGDLTAKFRTVFFNRDKGQGNADSTAASQAFMLQYQSPYIADVIGIDATGFANLKLHGDSNKGGTGVLRDEADGSQSSYWKLGEVNIKAKYQDIADGRIGRMFIDTPLLNDSDSRATPSTTQGILGNLKFGNLKFFGVISNQGSAKTAGKFNKYVDTSGDEYEIYVGGAEYKFENGAYLHGSIGHAENVMTKLYSNANYPWEINKDTSLFIDYHQYFGEADGNGAQPGVGANYSTYLSNVAAQLSYGKLKIAGSIQQVGGDAHVISWDNFTNDDSGYYTWNDVQRFSFDNAEERSYQARIDYDFGDFIEGVSAMARYTYGEHIERTAEGDGSEWERNVELMYSPPKIENLHFRWRHAYNKSSETHDSSEHRFFINYSYDLL